MFLNVNLFFQCCILNLLGICVQTDEVFKKSFIEFNKFVIIQKTLLYHNAGCTEILLCELRIGPNNFQSYNCLFDENSLALRRNNWNSFMNMHEVLSHNWAQFGKSRNINFSPKSYIADHLIYECKYNTKMKLPYIPTWAEFLF